MITPFILNSIASSLLSFLISLGLVLLFSRAKNPRFLATLFLLPFLKVAWDHFAMHPNWVCLKNLSILQAPENSRNLSVSLLPHFQVDFTLFSLKFSLGDIINEWQPFLASTLAFMFLSISSLKFIHRLILFKRRRLDNTPCAVIGFWKPKIRFSRSYFTLLTPEEKDAVLSHEKSHIRWGDHLVSHFLYFFEAIFWFLPFKKWLLKKLQLNQELACDRAAKAPLAISTALKKALIHKRPPCILSFVSPSQTRVASLLQGTTRTLPLWKRLTYVLTFWLVFGFIVTSQFLPF